MAYYETSCSVDDPKQKIARGCNRSCYERYSANMPRNPTTQMLSLSGLLAGPNTSCTSGSKENIFDNWNLYEVSITCSSVRSSLEGRAQPSPIAQGASSSMLTRKISTLE